MSLHANPGSTPRNQHPSGAPRGRLLRLCQKELRETLRDRRTIITLVMMPLLVYPILSMTLNRFLLSATLGNDPRFIVGLESNEEGQWLKDLIADPDSQPPEAIRLAADERIAEFSFVGPTGDKSLDDILIEKLVDVTVRVSKEAPYRVNIKSLADEPNGINAKRILTERITYFNQRQIERAFANSGKPIPPQISIQLEQEGQSLKPTLLASIVPLVLVLMTITGAVYPAIDLTAGERERGTMEALMASPVPRGLVLLAKYTAVVTVALLTAVANLGSMLATLWAGGLLELLVGKDKPIPWWQFLQIFGLLILFAGFFSAVLLALTSFARSFKEAQAYLIPLMLVSLTPGVLSLMPGVQLTGSLAVVPLLNIILLSREILSGTVTALPMLVAIFSTLCYASAALLIAARLFGSDAVLRGSEISFSAALRRPDERKYVPSLSAAATTLALIFPTYYMVSNGLGHLQDQQISTRLVINAIALAFVFGGIPLFSVWYSKYAPQATYRLNYAHIMTMLGALLLGLGLWTWAHEIFVLGEVLGIQSLDVSKVDQVNQLVSDLRKIPAWLVVATLALTPGIIEELFFRGYLFSALRTQMSPWKSILLSALLFGVFHVLTGRSLLVERFLPTTMLGVALGYVAWRTGSVIPGIVLHVTHNAFLELVAIYRDNLEKWGIGVAEQTHLPWTWVMAGTLIVISGFAIVTFFGRLGSPHESSPSIAN